MPSWKRISEFCTKLRTDRSDVLGSGGELLKVDVTQISRKSLPKPKIKWNGYRVRKHFAELPLIDSTLALIVLLALMFPLAVRCPLVDEKLGE